MGHFNEDPQKLAIGHLLAHVCRLVGSRRRMKLESIGLHHAQGMVLFRLWQEDGIPQRVLAQALHITPPTASSTLQRMERDGWIQRRRDESDQRIVRVHLTEAARRLREDARASFIELDKEMTSLLTDHEHETLRQSLLKVHRYLVQTESADTDRSCSPQTTSPNSEEKRR
jgi:MarR family transcriptional regulator, organic hydroperoxide resistance regulator